MDIKARGLAIAPVATVGYAARRFRKAIAEAFPSTRHQRRWFHNILNILNKFPKSMAPAVTSAQIQRRRPWRQSSPSPKNMGSNTPPPHQGFLVAKHREADGLHPRARAVQDLAPPQRCTSVATRHPNSSIAQGESGSGKLRRLTAPPASLATLSCLVKHRFVGAGPTATTPGHWQREARFGSGLPPSRVSLLVGWAVRLFPSGKRRFAHLPQPSLA